MGSAGTVIVRRVEVAAGGGRGCGHGEPAGGIDDRRAGGARRERQLARSPSGGSMPVAPRSAPACRSGRRSRARSARRSRSGSARRSRSGSGSAWPSRSRSARSWPSASADARRRRAAARSRRRLEGGRPDQRDEDAALEVGQVEPDTLVVDLPDALQRGQECGLLGHDVIGAGHPRRRERTDRGERAVRGVRPLVGVAAGRPGDLVAAGRRRSAPCPGAGRSGSSASARTTRRSTIRAADWPAPHRTRAGSTRSAPRIVSVLSRALTL